MSVCLTICLQNVSPLIQSELFDNVIQLNVCGKIILGWLVLICLYFFSIKHFKACIEYLCNILVYLVFFFKVAGITTLMPASSSLSSES